MLPLNEYEFVGGGVGACVVGAAATAASAGMPGFSGRQVDGTAVELDEEQIRKLGLCGARFERAGGAARARFVAGSVCGAEVCGDEGADLARDARGEQRGHVAEREEQRKLQR